MKHIIPSILALLVALTACGQPQALEPPGAGTAPAPPVESGPEPVSVCTVAEGITFSLLQSVYPPGVERLTMVMDNRSDFELCHGEYVAFQQYAGGQWQTLAYAARDVVFHDVAWVLQPHRAGQFTIDANLLARPLEEGLYRVSGDAQMWLNSEDSALHEPVPGWQVTFRVAAEATPEPEEAVSRYAAVGLTEEDAYILACLVYHEARGEPFEGQAAVVEVVFNRCLSDEFPDTVEEVVFQKYGDVWQFSPAPYLYTAEPGETQYSAVMYAYNAEEPIDPPETVFFSTSPYNEHVTAIIGNHYFCKIGG